MPVSASGPSWPELNWQDWHETAETLHRWTQVVGKVRMALAPLVNHWWNVTFTVTSRGLTTSPIPYRGSFFDITFDFIDHILLIDTAGGEREQIKLEPMSVAVFHGTVIRRLRKLGIEVHFWTMPCEIAEAVRFEDDHSHKSYDAPYAQRFWRALLQTHGVFSAFRAQFLGKVSPVQFFWGSFDLAVTRFSGRPAPPHPGVAPNTANWVMREAYSHEVSSAGFWPGNGGYGRAAFYSYAYPEPPELGTAKLCTHGAFYDEQLKEFVLPYDDVRSSSDPDGALMMFLQDTYVAAADCGRWHRTSLERQIAMLSHR